MPKGIYIRTKTWKLTEEQKQRISEGKRGDKHWNWKDKNISYSQSHWWLSKHEVKPKQCEFCKGSGRIEWAKKIGYEYQRNRENYYALCVKCHRRYDMTGEKRLKLIENLKKTPNWLALNKKDGRNPENND